MSIGIKGDPGKDEWLLRQAQELVDLFEADLNNFSSETIVELKGIMRPILGDDDGHGDRALDRLLVRLQQSPRCDVETRAKIGEVRKFVDAKKLPRTKIEADAPATTPGVEVQVPEAEPQLPTTAETAETGASATETASGQL